MLPAARRSAAALADGGAGEAVAARALPVRLVAIDRSVVLRHDRRQIPTVFSSGAARTRKRISMTAGAVPGRHIEVNGASLYVEEHGQGPPVVLVHPGLTSSAAYSGVVPLLAEQCRVITFDTRGHGHSTNPSGELSYTAIADDTAALMTALGLAQPVVGGWSDGGHVALEVGLRHPGQARALIVGAAFADFERIRPQVRDAFRVNADGRVDTEAYARQYADSVLPMMRRWQPGGEEQIWRIVQWEATMLLTYPGLTDEQLRRIETPALVIHADRDELIDLDAALDLFRGLPDAELAILPGATHMRPMFDPATFVRVVTDFLQRH